MKFNRLSMIMAAAMALAEKLAETGVIKKTDKKQWVLNLLENNDIIIDEKISALVESAVKQLDIVVDAVKDELTPEEVQ